MTRTGEQMTAAQELAAAAPGSRVTVDTEGWPICRGRHGRLEHLGAGQLAAFTRGPHIFRRLLALPGVRRHQTGDDEYRVLVSAEAVPAVAALLRCHRKRSAAQAAHLLKHAYGGASGGAKPTGAAETTASMPSVLTGGPTPAAAPAQGGGA
jgi:hypothetical protein